MRGREGRQLPAPHHCGPGPATRGNCDRPGCWREPPPRLVLTQHPAVRAALRASDSLRVGITTLGHTHARTGPQTAAI